MLRSLIARLICRLRGGHADASTGHVRYWVGGVCQFQQDKVVCLKCLRRSHGPMREL
jgi:hypothetical protein